MIETHIGGQNRIAILRCIRRKGGPVTVLADEQRLFLGLAGPHLHDKVQLGDLQSIRVDADQAGILAGACLLWNRDRKGRVADLARPRDDAKLPARFARARIERLDVSRRCLPACRRIGALWRRRRHTHDDDVATHLRDARP